MSCINNLHSNVSFAAQTPIYDQLEWSWAKLLHEFASASGRIWQRRRERQALLELDDRLLEDVGVTREQAIRQANKWFWQ
jgi:uncharacterized protein YjiS (DUF1127 family)